MTLLPNCIDEPMCHIDSKGLRFDQSVKKPF